MPKVRSASLSEAVLVGRPAGALPWPSFFGYVARTSSLKRRALARVASLEKGCSSFERPGMNVEFESLLDSFEAAKLLGIHPKTLQRMARNGEVPGIRVGKFWRFRASLLDAWVRSAVESEYPVRIATD